MRSCLVFTVFLLLGIKGSCQTDTTVIPIVANWNAGDTWQYDVTKIKSTLQGQKLMQKDTMHYRAEFRVVALDSASYTIQWSMANPFFEAFGLPEAARKKLAQYANTIVIYKTTATGAYVGIDNWQEISHMLNDMISEEILNKTGDTSKLAQQIRNSLKTMASVYATKRGIEQLVFKELMMFHFPLGKEYTVGKLYNYYEKIPLMRNSQPATGNGVIVLRGYDKEKETCDLIQKMKIVPDSANMMLKNYFIRLGMRKEAIGRAISESMLRVNDDNIFHYLYNAGIPVRISVSRETVIDVLDDHVKQIDKTIIEKVP